MAAYIAGADTIVVKGKDTATVCEEARLKLSGLEIVEEQRDRTVMRVLANEEDLNFSVLLRRLYAVSEAMCNLALRKLQTNEDVKLEAQRRDNDADRLYLLIMRCLYNTHGTYSPMKVLATRIMERIADHAEDICSVEGNVLPNAELASIMQNALQIYSNSFKCLLAVRIDEDLFDRHDDIMRRAEKKAVSLIKSEKSKERALELSLIWANCSRMIGYSLDMCEIAANMHYLGEKAQVP